MAHKVTPVHVPIQLVLTTEPQDVLDAWTLILYFNLFQQVQM